MQDLSILEYADSLAMSDIVMAWSVTESDAPSKFGRGDLRVIPMPHRLYRSDQAVYVHYEAYNLAPDRFGQTNYKVSYTVRRDVRRSPGLFGAVAAGMRELFGRKEEALGVSYERICDRDGERIYFGIEPERLKAGWNQIEIRIDDLIGQNTVSKKATFRMSPGPESGT